MEDKIKALAEYLEIEIDEIEENAWDGFDADGAEYMVLTDEEANEKAKEYIEESVWAFNKSFLDCHSEAISEMDDEVFQKIQEMCESANKTIMRLIDDFDYFVEDAMSADGRGHFMSSYDGEEIEQGEFYIYRTN